MEKSITESVLLLNILISLLFVQNAGAAIPLQERYGLLAIAYTGQPDGVNRWWSGVEGTECTWAGVKCDEQEEHVVELDLSYRRMIRLSDDINQLQGLTKLDLGRTTLDSLPVEICDLTALVEINLSGNKLNAIPTACEQWQQLERLNLNSNQFEVIPELVFALNELTHLEVGNNNITSLPSELWELTSLTSLNISSNNIKELSPQIANLKALTNLGLGNIGLRALPKELYSLINLETLGISSNNLTELSPEIKSLTALSRFYISGNLFSELPLEITQLPEIPDIKVFNCTSPKNCEANFYFSRNCLSKYLSDDGADLTEEQTIVSDWLKQFADFGFTDPYARPQRDFCTKILDKTNQVILQNTDDGTRLSLVSHSSEIDNAILNGFQHYAVYPFNKGNEAGSRLIQGELIQIENQIWQVPVSGLAQGDYRIVFTKPDINEPGGLVGVSLGATKLQIKKDIQEGHDFTGMLLNQPNEMTETFGNHVNLNYPVFVGNPTPFSKILEIEGLADLQQTSEGLVLHEGETSFHVRPVMIKYTGAKKPELQYTDDNFYWLRTNNQRLIKAVPGLAAAKAFSVSLEEHELKVMDTSEEGRMTIHAVASQEGHDFFYSVQADIASTPATMNLEPGLYFQDIEGLPNVKRAYYVFFDENHNVRQQAVPSSPIDWKKLKYDLERIEGISLENVRSISLKQNGFLTMVTDRRTYSGYLDYRVNRYFTENSSGVTQFGVRSTVDVNGDSIPDAVHIFNYQQKTYSQIIYMLPES